MLQVSNLQKTYHKKMVLKDVSFTLSEGEIITILGANGAGKTTILNCLLRMIKPDFGSISLDGIDILSQKNNQYFKKISAVLESSSNVYDYLNGLQNIEYFVGISDINVRSKKLKEAMEYYAKLFQMEQVLSIKVGNYSRGMKQKLAIMIALLVEPKILILDEPTLGLDIQSKWAMIESLKKIVTEKKISIILTTHQMEVVEKLGGKLLFLKNGMIEEYESMEKLKIPSERYKILYMDSENNIISKEVEGTFHEVFYQYQDYQIQEIKKIEIDIEQLIVEKLNESDKE